MWKLVLTWTDLNIGFDSFFTHMYRWYKYNIKNASTNVLASRKSSQSTHKKYLLYVQTAFFSIFPARSFVSTSTFYRSYDHFKLWSSRYATLESAIVPGSFVMYTYTTYFYNVWIAGKAFMQAFCTVCSPNRCSAQLQLTERSQSWDAFIKTFHLPVIKFYLYIYIYNI